MSDVYIGIDQSLSGFALCAYYPDQYGDTKDFLWSFPAAKYGSGVDRLAEIADTLGGAVHELDKGGNSIKHVCIEGYAMDRKFGREVSAELGAMVKLTLSWALLGVVRFPTIVPPASLKKFATGSGKSPKDSVMLYVYKKWGKEYSNNNQADAYVLARIAHALHTGETGLAYERDVLGALCPHTEMFPRVA